MVQQACAQRGHDNRQTGNFPGAYSVFTLALETLQLKKQFGSVPLPLGSEFFKSLQSNEHINEILKYFRKYNYEDFLNSYDYKEFKKLIITIIKIFKTNNKTKDDFKKLFKEDSFLSLIHI